MLLSKSGNTTSACVRKRHVGKKVSDTKRRNGPWDASHFVRLTSFSLQPQIQVLTEPRHSQAP